MPRTPIASIALHYDYDLVPARQRARLVAELLGFNEQEQTRIATVASEIARNAIRYAGGGMFELAVQDADGRQALVMTVIDRGRGIENLDDVLDGRYESKTGLGIGLTGARRLMDDFAIQTTHRGTTVTLKKLRPSFLPRLSPLRLQEIAGELADKKAENPIEEMQQQNGELLRALADLNTRQEELQRLNQELEDTNRGVLALYAEIDEKAESLRRADQVKTRFLNDMSHEFRTPVNSILALTRLLEEDIREGESYKQVTLIRRSAESLAELVEDLLDLAKIEAGKIEIRVSEFEVTNFFSALRGMLRPLLVGRSVSLVFDETEGLPPMTTDEGKVSQILRNFISNALKFTEAGEVRVSAIPMADRRSMRFEVTDTGIGIAEADQPRIFEEFTQIDGPLQRIRKGTGLGLPLTRKLANLLGGEVGVSSTVGVGSTFWAEIPIQYGEVRNDGGAAKMTPVTVSEGTDAPKLRLLIVDDDETARYTARSFAARDGLQIFEAENGVQGIAIALQEKPDVILLDLMMPGIGGHEVLQRLKSDATTADIPVIVCTSRFINDDERNQIMTRAAKVIYKGDLSREVVTNAIDQALAGQ